MAAANPRQVVLDLRAPRQFVDAWLQKIFADGEWAKLWKATIGTKIAGNPPAVPVIGSAAGS